MHVADLAFTRTALVAALAAALGIGLGIGVSRAAPEVSMPEYGCVMPMAVPEVPVEVHEVAQEPRGRVVVTDTETTILDVIEFERDTATIRDASHATLDAVAATLQGNPSIQLVEIQSHVAMDPWNGAAVQLTQQRADAVMAYLVRAGVEPARLTAQGYGGTQPIADATDPDARTKNERIAFLILKRATDL